MEGDQIIIASERSARLKFVEDLVHLWVWNSKAEVRLTVRCKFTQTILILILEGVIPYDYNIT